MQTFQDFVNENWASQAKAKLAGLGSSIAGDKQGAAVKQAQSLVKSSNLHGIFDKFKQDLIELTKSSNELEFNKKFPEQAKFIANITANLEVLKSGNVGAPAAPEQQPDVATQKGAASQARRQARQAANQQNQDIARQQAQQAQQPQPAVQTASVHVNDNDMINEAYGSVQEAPFDNTRAKFAGARAKLGNIAKTLTGRGGDVVNALKATIDNRIESFKKQFQTGLGKLQTDLGALGLGEDSPAIQAINNSMGSAEQIPEPTPDQVQAATPDADAAADAEAGAADQAADDAAAAQDAEAEYAAQQQADDDAASAEAEYAAQQQADDDDAAAAAADDAEQQRQADAEVPKKRELSQTPRNIARRAKTAANRAAKVKKRAQMDQKNTRARDKRAGLAMDPKNIKRREKRRGTWRGESAMRGTRSFNEFVSRYL